MIPLTEDSADKESQANEEAFHFQLEILKMEIQTIDGILGRLDEMAQFYKELGCSNLGWRPCSSPWGRCRTQEVRRAYSSSSSCILVH